MLSFFISWWFIAGAARANWIVAENRLRGVASEEWDVNGAGSDDVVGFSSRASALPGERVEFKVSTTSPFESSLEIDVFRFGWYDGMGARRVASLSLSEDDKEKAGSQPECSRPEPELADCGNWRAVATFDVPRDAVSGLYAARFSLEGDGGWREDGSKKQYDPHHAVCGRDPGLPPEAGPHAYGAAGKYKGGRSKMRRPRASLAFFVVRAPLASSHQLLLQTADTTWHAYNGWGGLTTYGSFEFPWRHAPNRTYMAEGDAMNRAFKRSYNTPLVTRDYRAVNSPFGVEIAAIRFLERVGVDLHYCTGLDLGIRHRAKDILSRSRAYLSVGHDEYWSYAQREEVEAARDIAGVHLNFWSGNEAYWAIRWEKSEFDDDDAPRTMVCYKETQSSTKLDRPQYWTGTFRDARPLNPFGPRPENALTGTMFVANAQRNDPLFVDAFRFGQHRAWRHTAVSGENRTFVLGPAGILGHEWDEDVDNGWRPAGLQRLSESTFDNVQAIQDWGGTFDTGRATHSLVLFYRGKAMTFGAGCVQFSWALDDMHDVNDPQRANKYSIRVAKDPIGTQPIIQQLAVNILSDQGVDLPLLSDSFSSILVQPSRSTDESAPDGSIDAACYSASGVVEASGKATDVGGNVAGVELSWDSGGESEEGRRRWHPAALARVAPLASWSFRWGDEEWQRLHGQPPDKHSQYRLSLRIVDDSGNIKTLDLPNRLVECPLSHFGAADKDEL